MLELLDPNLADLRPLLRDFEVSLGLWSPWILSIYYGALTVLSLYGVHRLHLLWLLIRGRSSRGPNTAGSSALDRRLAWAEREPALVTVQLPIYNERSVATRLIDAVARLDYPRDRLEIQVLDDSTDETSALVARSVALWQQRGIAISHLRRSERKGFKAGALAQGLRSANGEFIAIFDADFVPAPDFLQRVLPHFADQRLGMVQARWDYLNRDHSLLTRIQATLLDGHFLIEHAARSASGRFFNFNGTAGVWRRQAIEDGGGWQHDTLTEDLDLSYRSQMAGWRFHFLDDHGVPSELPTGLAAYRGQQRRWTRGSAQTLRKLGRQLMRSPLPRRQRFEALAHLSSNLGYPLTVVVAVLLPLVVYCRILGSEPHLLWVDLGLLFAGTFSLSAFYLEARRRRGLPLLSGLLLLAPLLALCMGMSWLNAKASLAGLWSRGGVFERTPKGAYAAARRFPWGETVLTLYLGTSTLLLAAVHAYSGLPFILLFLFGFGSSAAILWRGRPGTRNIGRDHLGDLRTSSDRDVGEDMSWSVKGGTSGSWAGIGSAGGGSSRSLHATKALPADSIDTFAARETLREDSLASASR